VYSESMTSELMWIVGAGLLMSSLGLVGGVTLFFPESTLKKILLPMVALSAGALLGGAFFHVIPEAVEEMQNRLGLYVWILIGFASFFVLEQFLHWHHCHKTVSEHKRPLTYLILIADGVHNMLDGFAFAGSFLIDLQVGILTWLAIAGHKIPQALGEFGVLVHGGWPKGKALAYNFFSGLPFVLGGILTYFLSFKLDIAFLLPFAAGSFIYIAAVDLVPEINKHQTARLALLHFLLFLSGLGILLMVKMVFEP
jgi:zinc and cadmium transporter